MNPDTLGRTRKLELDEGRAASLDEADELVSRYRLGLIVGEGQDWHRTRAASLLTAIETGRRAFPGGVFVQAADDPVLPGWARNRRLSEIAAQRGVSLVGELPADVPIALGYGSRAHNGSVIHITWEGWAGGIVLDERTRSTEDDTNPLAGMLAGAFGVAEAFQQIRGFPSAGRRAVGLSLWRPDRPWDSPDARGPDLEYLPQKLWLLGLGHLGQAYAWGLGWLPYADGDGPVVGLVDPEEVAIANMETGLLVSASAVGQKKTRAVAAALEALGMSTRIVERKFDATFSPCGDEPQIALAGFDDGAPRRVLDGAGFVRVVDGGLGAGRMYLEGAVHTFPSQLSSAVAFEHQGGVSPAPSSPLDLPAYRAEVDRRVQAGETHEAAGCGVLEVAGRVAGAAFVGSVASAFVLSEELRAIVEGPRFALTTFSLRTGSSDAVLNRSPGPYRNVGFVRARKAD